MAGAYETKQYRNVFAEYGYSEEEIEKRVQETFSYISSIPSLARTFRSMFFTLSPNCIRM